MSTSATADEPPAGPSEQPQRPPSRNPHLHGTVKSMIWSTVFVTALVLGFYALVARPDQVARPAVDAPGIAEEARRATGWPLGVLEGLGDGWAPTVARLEPGADGLRTWQVRYVKGTDRYVAVTQTKAATPGWVSAQVKGRPAAAPVRVGALSLDAFDKGGACTLVRKGGADLTTVIETGESCTQAAGYAARLAPALR